jgi:hypothetical protein
MIPSNITHEDHFLPSYTQQTIFERIPRPNLYPTIMRKNKRGVQGKLYTIKAKSACIKEGISYSPLPKGVAGHMVVVLSEPDSQNNVKFATV